MQNELDRRYSFTFLMVACMDLSYYMSLWKEILLPTTDAILVKLFHLIAKHVTNPLSVKAKLTRLILIEHANLDSKQLQLVAFQTLAGCYGRWLEHYPILEVH